MWFRVLAGAHVQDEPTGNMIERADHLGRVSVVPEKLPYRYPTGSIVKTDTDLVERFNPKDPAMSKKFERITEDMAAVLIAERKQKTVEQAIQEMKDRKAQRESDIHGTPPSTSQLTSTQVVDNVVRATKADGPPPSAGFAGQPTSPPPVSDKEYVAQLEKMNEKQLREHAAEEEVDLKNARTKQDMVNILKSALKPAG